MDRGWVPTDNSGLPFQQPQSLHHCYPQWQEKLKYCKGRDRWWGRKREWREQGKRLGMKEKWEERVRTNSNRGKPGFTRRGNCNQQVRGNQASKSEWGQTEELRLRARKKNLMNYLANIWGSSGSTSWTGSFQAVIRRKGGLFCTRNTRGKEMLRAAVEPSTEQEENSKAVSIKRNQVSKILTCVREWNRPRKKS